MSVVDPPAQTGGSAVGLRTVSLELLTGSVAAKPKVPCVARRAHTIRTRVPEATAGRRPRARKALPGLVMIVDPLRWLGSCAYGPVMETCTAATALAAGWGLSGTVA